MSEFAPKAQVRKIVEEADIFEKEKGEKIIDEEEKKVIAERFRNAKKLQKMANSTDFDEREALDDAIDDVADDYDGLRPHEIYSWIFAKESSRDFKSRHEGVSIPEKDPGTRRFGKPAKESEVHKAYEGLKAKERRDIMTEALETIKLTPAQNRRLEQLKLITALAEGSLRILEKGGKDYIDKVKFLRFTQGRMLGQQKRRVDSFLSNETPRLANLIMRNPETPLKDLLKDTVFGDIMSYGPIVITYKDLNISLDFDECKSESELIQQKNNVLKFMREFGDYQNVRFIAEAELEQEFHRARKKEFDKLSKQAVRIGAEGETAMVNRVLYSKSLVKISQNINKSEMIDKVLEKAPNLSYTKAKKKIEQIIEEIIYQDYLHSESEAIADYIDEEDVAEKWPQHKKELWGEYKDSMGIGAFDMADQSWDGIIDELIVNAPLIVVSGGVVGALSRGASMVLRSARVARLAARGTQLGVRAAGIGRAIVGTGRIGKYATKGAELVFKGTGRASAMLAEGAAFELIHSGIHPDAEWLVGSPDWIERIVWTSAALGIFKGAGKLSQKTIARPKLQKMLTSIKNPKVSKAIGKVLALGTHGSLEVGAMLILGAAQNGYYKGNLDDFFEHFGEELFHSLVAVGALKISGKGVQTLTGNMAAFKSAKDTSAIREHVRSAKRKGNRISAPKKNLSKKHRLLERLSETEFQNMVDTAIQKASKSNDNTKIKYLREVKKRGSAFVDENGIVFVNEARIQGKSFGELKQLIIHERSHQMLYGLNKAERTKMISVVKKQKNFEDTLQLFLNENPSYKRVGKARQINELIAHYHEAKKESAKSRNSYQKELVKNVEPILKQLKKEGIDLTKPILTALEARVAGVKMEADEASLAAKLDVLHVGDEINVPRSDGSISKGRVVGPDGKGGITVEFTSKNTYTLDQIDNYNPGQISLDIGTKIVVPKLGPIIEGKIIGFERGLPVVEYGGVKNMSYEQIKNANPHDQIKSAQEALRAPRKAEKAKMPEVLAIGDSNGSFETYKWNLEKTGLIDKDFNWKGGNRKVVVHGDILADRAMDGFKILEINRKLRAEAQKQGGDISLIAGNHEDFMFSFLLDRGGVHGDGLVNAEIKNPGEQGRGIAELTEFTGNGKLIKSIEKAKAGNRLDRNEILKNMRKSPRGRMLLEEMCNMKLCEQIGDTIYLHTDPTNGIMEMILNKGVDGVNKEFQTAMRRTLIDGESFNHGRFNSLFDTFLDTGNRTFYHGLRRGELDINSDLIEALKGRGIARMVFGHSDLGRGKRKTIVEGIEFVNVDQGALKGGQGTISAARIRPSGDVETGTMMQ